MANLPISGLTASSTNLASTDLAPVVQTVGVGPVKMTGLQLAGGLLGSATFNGATVTTSQPVLNLSQTWNAGAVTFTGLRFNATDTASASGSLLLDLQTNTGGAPTSRFNVSKAGLVTLASMNIGSFSTISAASNNILAFGSGATIDVNSNVGSFIVNSTGSFAFASGLPSNRASADTILTRDAANTLALKNSTNPQIFRAYSTTTGPSYGYFASGVTDAGVATADTLFIGTGGAGAAMTKLALVQNGTTRLYIDAAGNLNTSADTAYSFGSGIRTVEINGSTSGFNTAQGALTFKSKTGSNGANAIYCAGGAMSFYAGSTTFAAMTEYLILSTTGLLQFAGTTSSFPALKRSTTTLQVRLADDSGDAALQCGTQTAGGTAFNVNGTGGNSIASVTNTTTGTLLQVLNSTSNPLMTVTDTTAGTLFSVQSTTAATLFSVNDTTSGTLLAVTNSSSNDVFSVADGGAITGYDDTSANVLAIRNGTSLQTLRVYGTYTSSTNYERLFAGYVSAASAFRIGTEKGVGGGTARPLELQTDGTTRLTIGAAGAITQTAGTLADGANAYSLTATMPSVTTAGATAVNWTITSAGSSTFGQIGANITLASGYTGSGSTSGVLIINSVAGTSSTYGAGGSTTGYRPFGNRCFNTTCNGSGAGINVGGLAIAASSTTANYGVWGSATFAVNSSWNVGVAGFGLNTGTGTQEIGGFFALYDGGTSAPNLVSAALVADNGTSSNPIFLARDNASTVFTIANGGAVTTTSSIETGAPTGGTAAAWKFGSRVAATTTLDTTQYIELDVGGTLYKLAVVTS